MSGFAEVVEISVRIGFDPAEPERAGATFAVRVGSTSLPDSYRHGFPSHTAEEAFAAGLDAALEYLQRKRANAGRELEAVRSACAVSPCCVAAKAGEDVEGVPT